MHENKRRNVDDLPIMLKVKDLMEFLGITKGSAYELARSNKLATLRIGRCIRIPKGALIKYLIQEGDLSDTAIAPANVEGYNEDDLKHDGSFGARHRKE